MYMIRFAHFEDGMLRVHYVKSMELVSNDLRGLTHYKLTDNDGNIMLLQVMYTIVASINVVWTDPNDIDGSEAIWRLQHSHAD